MFDILKTKTKIAYHRYKFKKNPPKLQLAEEFKSVFQELNKNGVVAIPDFFSKEECDLYRTEIDKLLIKHEGKYWVDDEASDHRIYGAERVSDLMAKYGYNQKLQSVGENYLNTELKLTMCLAAKLVFKENNKGSGGGWHRDSVNVNEFKAILYLSDVEEENGPFTYLLGSHDDTNVINSINFCGIQYGQLRLTEEEVLKIEKKFNLKKTTFTAKAGTLILVDTRGIHIGSPIKKGARYALTNYYSPLAIYDKMMGYSSKVIIKND